MNDPKKYQRLRRNGDFFRGWCGQMFQMFEYLRVVRTVTSKFRFFTLENGQKFQNRFEDTRFPH